MVKARLAVNMQIARLGKEKPSGKGKSRAEKATKPKEAPIWPTLLFVVAHTNV